MILNLGTARLFRLAEKGGKISGFNEGINYLIRWMHFYQVRLYNSSIIRTSIMILIY